jgi:hypothetical protein
MFKQQLLASSPLLWLVELHCNGGADACELCDCA